MDAVVTMTATGRRVTTAVLMLALFVPAVLWAPAWLWGLLMAVVAAAAAYEWGRLSHFAPSSARGYAAVLGGVALALPYAAGAAWPALQTGLILLAVAFWLLLAPLWLAGRWQGSQAFLRAVVGAVVLLPTWAALLYLHARGPGVLLAVMAVVWIADSAAYFAGRRFGRHKLAPAISPGKTWEGIAGALVALALYAALLGGAVALPVPSLFLAMAGLLYLSVLGDLYESWIKRVSGTKDSGSMLPGHGGVLDRIDALTPTLPAAAAMLLWLGRAG